MPEQQYVEHFLFCNLQILRYCAEREFEGGIHLPAVSHTKKILPCVSHTKNIEELTGQLFLILKTNFSYISHSTLEKIWQNSRNTVHIIMNDLRNAENRMLCVSFENTYTETVFRPIGSWKLEAGRRKLVGGRRASVGRISHTILIHFSYNSHTN